MPTNLLKETFENAFEEFVDTRIGVILGTMRDDVNSSYSKHCDESDKICHEIIDILTPMGKEKRDLIFDLDGEYGTQACMAYKAIYRQAFLDGLNCKDINSVWKDVINNEQNKAS